MHISRNNNKCSSDSCNCITYDIQFVKSFPFCYQCRCYDQCNDQRNIDCPGEYSVKIFIKKNICHIVNTHVQHSRICLLYNICYRNHNVIFVRKQKFRRLYKAIFFYLIINNSITVQFLFRKLFYRENRNCIYNDTYNRKHDCNYLPGMCSASKDLYKLNCY